MVEKPSLMSQFLPQLEEWWGILLASPWLIAVFMILTLVSIRRHGELAYGSYRAMVFGPLFLIIYLAAQVLLGVSVTNLGFLSMFMVVILADRVVVSLSRSRSTFFVYDLGLILALLFLIHPAFLILSFFFLLKLRMIKSATFKHILAYIAGHLTILALATMFFATRSWESLLQYWSGWVAPLADLHFPKLVEVPLLVLDTIYLGAISIAVTQVIRASTVRVRVVMSMHLQLAWVLMVLHLLYGLQGAGNFGFLITSLYFSGVIADYLLTERRTKWLLLTLFVVLMAVVGVRIWIYFVRPLLG